MANPVILDASAAARIAATIQRVEIGDRSERPLTFSKVDTPGRKTFRIATFTGAWSIGATKTVTFKYQTSTPNTVVATNLFFPFPAPATAADCSIAKDGTAWFLVDVPFETATAVFASAAQTAACITHVTVSAVLNTTDCSITVSTTQSTAAITFVSSTYTSSFVRFKVT